jgi:hypothetical protein
MVKMLFHTKDAAAVLKGSGALPFLYKFFVNSSSAIVKLSATGLLEDR